MIFIIRGGAGMHSTTPTISLMVVVRMGVALCLLAALLASTNTRTPCCCCGCDARVSPMRTSTIIVIVGRVHGVRGAGAKRNIIGRNVSKPVRGAIIVTEPTQTRFRGAAKCQEGVTVSVGSIRKDDIYD